mmetsp:Transcript_228/g.524  ORF Transcript_228/g.524 Transcript_228/m.524 type:complete len:264 (-) Transcript_228:13-804(-)
METLLHSLHLERLRRRQTTPANEEAPKASDLSPKKSLPLHEVVACSHPSQARCLRCVGRSCPQVSQSAYVTFHDAYSACPHFISPTAGEASACQVPRRSLVAGEILFSSFAALVQDLGAGAKGKRFLDLGSGTGRAALAWTLLVPDGTAVGIEIRKSLHEQAMQVVEVLPEHLQRRLDLRCGNLFDYDSLEDADVILVNSTGFDESLMSMVTRKLTAVRQGSLIVTLSQPLGGPGWSLLREALYRMTWGNCTAFIYRKTDGCR